MKNFFRRPKIKRVQQISQLRALISEETRRILREAEEVGEEKGEDSLDAQVDKYLSDYEAEAKNLKKEGRDFRSLVRRFLREAPEDEEKEDEEDEEDEDAGEESDEEGEAEGGDEEGGEEEEDEEPEKLTLDDVNVESFADSVVRLVENYDSLLEVRNTILRRAVNYLTKTYDIDVVDSFKEVVQERHGIEIGKSKSEMEEDDFQPPAAARAGTSPGA